MTGPEFSWREFLLVTAQVITAGAAIGPVVCYRTLYEVDRPNLCGIADALCDGG